MAAGACLVKMVDARDGFVRAHREIAIAQSKSNLKETNFGCVGSGPLTTPAGLHVVVVAAATLPMRDNASTTGRPCSWPSQ